MKLFRKKFVILGTLGVLVAGSGVSYALIHHKDLSQTTPSTPIISSTTKKSTTQPGVSISASNSASQVNKKSTTNENSPKVAVAIAPSGSFVSNHHPTLSTPTNAMNSVCRTNTGATCQINFIQGNVIKTLGPDTVGSDGTISWEWKLQDIGLSTGSWQIQAVANSSGQTTSTNDPLSLEVGS